MTAFSVSSLVHKHQRDYVFPDGVKLGDALDAIAAAGAAGNYVLAGQLKIQYALDVCTMCGDGFIMPSQLRATLSEYGVDAFGAICHQCELELIAKGRRREHHRNVDPLTE